VTQLLEAVPLHVAHFGLQASQFPVELFITNPSWQEHEWTAEEDEHGIACGLQVTQLFASPPLQVAHVLSQAKQKSPEL